MRFNSIASSSMAADHTRRWSEVVPPETALSFAAIWDPEDGLVTFSGPELLNADSGGSTAARDLPLDANEGRSQILTIDGFSLPFSGMLQDGAGLGRRVQFMADALDEGQSILDPYMRYFEERRRAQGIKLDADLKARRRMVHIDWSQLRHASAAMASLGNRILKPFTITPPDDQSEHTYDGLFEEAPVTARTSSSAPMMVHLHLKSAFSVTTTSTTGYVDVDTPSEYSQGDSDVWSTLRDAGAATCPNRPAAARRRLRKPRPVPGDAAPARPADVLARAQYNHAPCARRLRSLPRIRIRAAPPSPAGSVDTDKTLPPLPPAAFRAAPPPCPGSSSAAAGERTLRKQRSVKDFVREQLARCHPRKRGDGDGGEHAWHA